MASFWGSPLTHYAARRPDASARSGGAGKPLHEAEALARVLLPEIQVFFEGEEGQREFAEWKAQQQSEQQKLT